MITAKVARDIVEQRKEKTKGVLVEVDRNIREAAMKGDRSIDFCFDERDFDAMFYLAVDCGFTLTCKSYMPDRGEVTYKISW